MTSIFRPLRTTVNEEEKIAFQYSSEIIDKIKEGTYDYSEIKHIAEFKEIIQEDKGIFFIAYCHGTDDCIFIHQAGDSSFKIADAHIFKDKYCYLVACRSLNNLGEAMMENGARGVVGYGRKIWMHLFDPEIKEILKRVFNSGILCWLEENDKTSEEICHVMYNAYEEELERLDNSPEATTSMVDTYGLLRSNKASLGYL